MEDYKAFIRVVLNDAAAIAVNNFGKVVGTVKPDDNNQVLTFTDIEIGELIVGSIREKYPEHNIIDEEAGVIDNKSSFTWIIDPIDGTNNFANGVPTFGVMIGLLQNDKPIAGGIALPAFNEIYIAARGQGTTCNGKQVFVGQEDRLLNSLVAYGIDGHQEDPAITRREVALLGTIVLSIRNLRSSNSVFDQAMVASGKYGASMNRTSKIWDNVAQQIVIEEAGGVYTDFYGEPMNYAEPITKADSNFTWCTASPKLHKQLMLMINNT